VEGIMFSGAFCIVYWVREEGILDGFTFANDLIAKDEGLHRDFACYLYKEMIVNKPAQDEIRELITESVDFAIEYINGIMTRLTGISNVSMAQYIKFTANQLYKKLGYTDELYTEENPFPWMDKISAHSKSNFFEKRVSNYSRSGFESKRVEDDAVELSDDF
jgi:ribonucleoside-diphosphate reductase beta chain